MQFEAVGEYQNQVEAEMWAEYLRGQGINARMVRRGAEIAAVGLDAWVPHDLVVPAEDAERARELLSSQSPTEAEEE